MKELQSSISRDLVAYWQAHRGDRAMPARRDIDPLTIPRATLPHVFLVDVEPEGRFRYRLIGTAVVAMTGRDITGQQISAQTYGPHAETVLRPFRRVAAERRPLAANLKAWSGDVPLVTESVFLPLGNGGTVDMVLGAIVRLVAHHSPLAKHLTADLGLDVRELVLGHQD